MCTAQYKRAFESPIARLHRHATASLGADLSVACEAAEGLQIFRVVDECCTTAAFAFASCQISSLRWLQADRRSWANWQDDRQDKNEEGADLLYRVLDVDVFINAISARGHEQHKRICMSQVRGWAPSRRHGLFQRSGCFVVCRLKAGSSSGCGKVREEE